MRSFGLGTYILAGKNSLDRRSKLYHSSRYPHPVLNLRTCMCLGNVCTHIHYSDSWLSPYLWCT